MTDRFEKMHQYVTNRLTNAREEQARIQRNITGAPQRANTLATWVNELSAAEAAVTEFETILRFFPLDPDEVGKGVPSTHGNRLTCQTCLRTIYEGAWCANCAPEKATKADLAYVERNSR